MTWESRKAELPEILRVDFMDGDCFSIELANGHSILLELGSRIGEPDFARLIENRLFDRPRTDGKRLFWPDGPSLTVAEIFAMLANSEPNGAKPTNQEERA